MLLKRAPFFALLLAPNDGAGGGDPATGGAGSGAATGANGAGANGAGASGGEDLAAKLRAAEAKLASIEKAAADAAAATAAAAKKEADDKLIADGKTQQLLAQRDAELAALKADAEFGRAARAAAEKSLEEGKAKLSEADRALVDLAPTFEAKQALVARLAPASTTTTATSSKGGGPPAPGGGVDFAKAWKDPDEWAEAEKKDPAGAAAWVKSKFQGNGQTVSFHKAPSTGA